MSGEAFRLRDSFTGADELSPTSKYGWAFGTGKGNPGACANSGACDSLFHSSSSSFTRALT